jgi:SAM-dependent methyltransferase
VKQFARVLRDLWNIFFECHAMTPDVSNLDAYDAAYFDGLFAASPDPWGFESRWYERRKRALTLACLPSPRFRYGYEPGCANGELSAALADRCDRLLVSDGSDKAVALARSRLKAYPQVEVMKAWVPEAWPDQTFDLIVLSEFLFYVSRPALEGIAARVLATLAPGGTVLACHWRHPVAHSVMNGDQAHEHLMHCLKLPTLCHVLEPDLRLDVWSAAPSVARQEGFV